MKTIYVMITASLFFGCAKPRAETDSRQHVSVQLPVNPNTTLSSDGIRMPGCSNSIVPPIFFTSCGSFRDGGTLAFHFVDAKSNAFVFCSDGREDSETGSAIYFGVDHPSYAGGYMLPEDSQFERELFSLIRIWLQEQEKQTKALPEPMAGLAGNDLQTIIALHFNDPRTIALHLKHIFTHRTNVLKTRRWLNEHYTYTQQDSLLRRSTPDGLNEQDRKAWYYVQSQHGYKSDPKQETRTPTTPPAVPSSTSNVDKVQ